MMMLSLVLAAGVAAEKPAAEAAPANVPDWSRSETHGSSFNIEFYKRFADCIVYRWSPLGGAYVAALPGSSQEEAALDALLEQARVCVFSGRVRLQHHWLRGAIAEQLLKRKAPLPKPAWLSGGESAEAFRTKLRSAYSADRPTVLDWRDMTLRVTAHCTLGESRPLVEALLRTEPGSRPERAALTQLSPTLSRCVKGGAMRAMGAPSVRAYLAEALYWRRALEGVA
jgi:hypothetical protein